MADGDSEAPKSGGPLKLILMIGIPVFLLSGIISGLYLGGVFSGTPSEEEEVDEQSKPAIYLPIDPPFVVNFNNSSNVKFLQVSMELMTRQAEVPDLVKIHMPVIRNNLLLLFSSQSFETVSTLEGKEALRSEALDVVQQVLEQESGDVGVEAVFFTSFVMQ